MELTTYQILAQDIIKQIDILVGNGWLDTPVANVYKSTLNSLTPTTNTQLAADTCSNIMSHLPKYAPVPALASTAATSVEDVINDASIIATQTAQQSILAARAAIVAAQLAEVKKTTSAIVTTNADGSITTAYSGYTSGSVGQNAVASQVAIETEISAQTNIDIVVNTNMVQFPNVDFDTTQTGVPPTPENYAAWNAATNSNNDTPNVADWNKFQADLQTLRDAHDQARIDDYDFNTRVDKINSAYTSGDYSANIGDALSGLADKAPGDGVDQTAVGGDSTGTGMGTNVAKVNLVTIDDHVGNYGGRGARLTQFIYADGTDDDDRLAYLQLVVPDDLMSSIATGENKQAMEALYAMVKDKYNRFIVNSLQENRAERSSIIKTVGDSFAVTFSGREPMVIHVSGSLVFDYDRSRMSWYTAFMNSYEYYMRASQTAKYRAKVRLVFPDFTEYTGYIISVGSAQSSDNDMVIPFNFSMLVVQEAFNKAYSYTDTSGVKTIASADNSALSKKDASSAVNNAVTTASAVGAATQAKVAASTATAAKAATASTASKGLNLSTLTNVLIGNSTNAKSNYNKYKSYYRSIGAIATSVGVRVPKSPV